MELAVENMAGNEATQGAHKQSMPNVTPAGRKTKDGKKAKKPIEIDSDYEEVLSEQFDTFSDNSPSKMGAYTVV